MHVAIEFPKHFNGFAVVHDVEYSLYIDSATSCILKQLVSYNWLEILFCTL